MKRILKGILLMAVILGCNKPDQSLSQKQETPNQKNQMNSSNINISDVTVKDMNGNDKKLSGYKGKVLLIVNVASQCGYTSQYEGLQEIYEKYKDKGFEVLGFPCNDFGEQEPGTNEEIRQFCESKYDVTFETFDKIKVLGDDKSNLYKKLVNFPSDPGDVKWNFEKFIIDKEGNVVQRFRSKTKPESEEVVNIIEKELKG